MPGPPQPSFQWLRSQPFRYFVTGCINTVFGYCSFALLYFALTRFIHYIAILTISTVVSVTFSYLMYKKFVFRTQANYIREYFRFYLVYAVPIGLSFGLFPLCVELLRMNPYVAQAVVMVITVVISYFGHKHVSFRVAPSA